VRQSHSLDHAIGQSPARKEGADKVTGQARYIDDIQELRGGEPLGEIIHGVTVRNTVPRGQLRNIRFLPGVNWDEFTIVTAADIASAGGENAIALIGYDQPCLAGDAVNHPEEAVLLVGHRDRTLAERARNLVQLDIQPRPPVFDMDESLRLGQEGKGGPGIIWGADNVFKRFEILKGDLDAGFRAAEVVVAGEYETGAQEQLYIETQGMLAYWSREGAVTVMGSMQCPYYIHKALMHLFKLPADKVRIIQSETGGGFGGKEEYPSMIAAHAALLARKAGRPAKIIYDRLEDMVATTKRHPSRTRIKTGWRRDGTLVAQDIDFRIDGGAYMTLSPVVLSRGGLHAAGPYACPNVRVLARAVATNAPPHGAFRGFGAPQSVFAIERHLDEAAAILGMSPEGLRRHNFVRDGLRLASSQVVKDHVDLGALLDRALSLSDFTRKRRAFAEENRVAVQKRSALRRGIGLATFLHGCGFTGSGERRLCSVVEVDADRDGRVRVRASSTEIGQGTNTIFTQIAAETLRLPGEFIEVVRPDTAEVPDSGPTVASRTCMVVGRLVADACQALLALLQRGTSLGKTYDAAEFRAACDEYHRRLGPLRASAQYQPPKDVFWDDENYRGDAYATYAWAAYVAEVEVDLCTYETRVSDFWAVQEVGKVVHQVLAAGQIEGGVAQAVGYALYEKVVWKEGRMQNGQLTNYIMPTSMDVPRIHCEFLEVPTPYGPAGAKGIGELPMDGTAPAILNAVEHATGIGVRAIPMTPEDLMQAVQLCGGRDLECN
jgi:CO/xanthine dehydrogenase Mo-binding subunit